MTSTAIGTCKLTGIRGRFVKSHLLPLALTRLSTTGEKYVEAGIGLGTKRRSNSWYDSELVTREGEDILAAIDARAIEALRRAKLVWSGWNEGEDSLERLFAQSGVGVRLMAMPQAADLQLFFLSLVWRAAASGRPEFSEVRVPDDVLGDLRRRVLLQDAGPFQDYPVQLFQITTRGMLHNRTPLLERKQVPNAQAKGPVGEVDYLRFYFDGLTSHVHLPCGIILGEEYLCTCLGLGKDAETLVFGHRFDESRAWGNIKEMTRTVMQEERTPPSKMSEVAWAVRHQLRAP